jgi:CDP-glycerol glycerophosphotransferase
MGTATPAAGSATSRRQFDGVHRHTPLFARRALDRLPAGLQAVARLLARAVRTRQSGNQASEHLVSVVVPIYNVERYLRACLDSLVAQTYPRLQIILVDDGSPDRCIDIMEAYVRRDRRIQIIRQANAGLSAARNIGAKAARGEYLMFVDADDTLELDAIKTHIRSLRRTGSDFSVASYRRMTPAGIMPPPPWIRRAHRVSRPAVTLHDVPDIQVNAVAWSKCFRHDFWNRERISFPEGVLYEDQAVASRAYVHASSFDVLSSALYNYRVRDDRSSITQQEAQIGNLQDRLNATFQSLAELERPGFERAREVRLAHYLSNDFPLSLKTAQHGDEHFWSLLREGATRLTAEATPFVWSLVPVQRRVVIQLVVRNKRPDVDWFIGLGHNNPKNSPTVASGGRAYFDTEVRYALGIELTDPLLALADHQLKLITATRRVFWTADDLLQVEGWAYIDNLSLADANPRVKAWAQQIDGHGRVRLRVEQRLTAEVTAVSKHRYADYEKSGFALWIDPAALLSHTKSRLATTSWQVVLELSAAGISRSGLLATLNRSGSAGRFSAHVLDGFKMTPRYTRRHGLAVVLSPTFCVLDHAQLDDRVLSLKVAGADSFVPYELELSNAAGSVIREPLRLLPDQRAEGTVIVPDPSAERAIGQTSRQWTVRVISLAGKRSPLAMIDHRAEPEPDGSPYLARTPRGNLSIVDEARSIRINSVKMTDDGALVVTGTLIGVTAERIRLQVVAPRASASGAAMSVGSARFEATIPLRNDPWQLGENALPSGSYRLECIEEIGYADRAEVAVHVEQQVIDNFPVQFATATLRGQLGLTDDDGLEIQLEPPLTDSERGARQQERLQLALRGRLNNPDYEFGSILLRSYCGEIAACNPLAVHRELRRRSTAHTIYWAVKDRSVQVPEGGIPVIHESAEWYRLLHDAHFYLDNMHQPLYHRKPPHQIQIQTFHGYPFKQMGLSHWTWQGRDKVHIQSYLDRAKDWDYLVSPATYGTKALCEEFGFEGKVLEIGYPRNDVLLSPEAPQIANLVRTRLGIRPDQTVILYGPMFREIAQNDFKASMVDFLDIARLSSALGDAYVILVRGHAFNAAHVEARVGSHGSLIDVTEYPDIADLCLASDAAILDYSSLRFDYALTGKPMIFMVPDLEQYQETSRSSLFAYEPTAPGPLVRTTNEVVAAAGDLPAVRRDYAEAYQTFRAEFLDLDDGHAAERLVDQVFMVEGLGAMTQPVV